MVQPNDALERWTDNAFAATRRARGIVGILRTAGAIVLALSALGIGGSLIGVVTSDDSDALIAIPVLLGAALATAISLGLLFAVASALELLATQTELSLIQDEDDDHAGGAA